MFDVSSTPHYTCVRKRRRTAVEVTVLILIDESRMG